MERFIFICATRESSRSPVSIGKAQMNPVCENSSQDPVKSSKAADSEACIPGSLPHAIET
jgi:hypothetical protein